MSPDSSERQMEESIQTHYADINGDQVVEGIATKLIEQGMVVEDREEEEEQDDDYLPF